jgi:hypothetical protein
VMVSPSRNNPVSVSSCASSSGGFRVFEAMMYVQKLRIISYVY